jgi:hydroxymethylglutaryl-CoA lyase
VSAGAVELVEVSPRDGLQAEAAVLPTSAKVELIARCVAAGVRRIEVASFVNPQRVPQMADAEAVLAALPHLEDVTYIGLVLNRRGFDRAAEAGVREVNVVAAASDTFAERNQGTTSDGSVAVFEELAPLALAAGMRPTLTISTSFGCPYEGAVDPARVGDIARRAVAAGAAEVAIADTIGVAVPADVHRVLDVVRAAAAGTSLRAHFHDTRHTGVANVLAAVDAGVDAVDASLGGIGGCPFAPGATGNVATEDVVYALERSGVRTGIDLAALVDVVPWVEAQLGHPLPGAVSKVGLPR